MDPRTVLYQAAAVDRPPTQSLDTDSMLHLYIGWPRRLYIECTCYWTEESFFRKSSPGVQAYQDTLTARTIARQRSPRLWRSPRFTHSKPLLKSLHWLPVRYRIICKICTITYQAYPCKQPSYLYSLFTFVSKKTCSASII